MTLGGVLLLALMLPATPGNGAGAAEAEVATATAPYQVGLLSPGLVPSVLVIAPAAGDGGSEKRRGWPLPLKLLVAEGSIVALSSAGHISDGVGQPPESGAMVLGGGLVGLGGFAAMMMLWASADANTVEEREGSYTLAVACVALIGAGAYNLYLHKNQADGPEIFRGNMIALNAVPLVTWGVAKLNHWRFSFWPQTSGTARGRVRDPMVLAIDPEGVLALDELMRWRGSTGDSLRFLEDTQIRKAALARSVATDDATRLEPLEVSWIRRETSMSRIF